MQTVVVPLVIVFTQQGNAKASKIRKKQFCNNVGALNLVYAYADRVLLFLQ